jgi:single-strand DNA-binding protein
MSGRSLNKVMLIGNLTRDPNVRFTPNGTAVSTFSIATNRTWIPAEGGERQEKVEFHNIVAWGKSAELTGQLLHKGEKAFIEGRLQTREYQGEDGVTKRITEIVMENMILLSPRGGGQRIEGGEEMPEENMPSPRPTKYSSKKSAAAEPVVSDQVSDVQDIADDIPF